MGAVASTGLTVQLISVLDLLLQVEQRYLKSGQEKVDSHFRSPLTRFSNACVFLLTGSLASVGSTMV